MAVIDDVKAALGVVGDHADAALNVHVQAVTDYLLGAGVADTAIKNGKATGAIVRGVADLWNAGSGDVSFSPVFYDMATQLAVTYPEGGGE